jgi:hypothetical protein
MKINHEETKNTKVSSLVSPFVFFVSSWLIF